MQTKNNFTRDAIILGFAIFSMYFGAGNIIFPPYLGLTSASDWYISFFSYFLADIGFATIAMFALLKVGGNVDDLTNKLGKLSGILLMSAIVLCIGPLIALPRTGATTYEMLVVPIFGASFSNSIITSIVYYSLIMFFTFRPTTMIEILGKILTPLLFFGLMFLIFKGFLTPIGEIKINDSNSNLFFDGLILGYQTLDVLAALAFGIIIIKIVKEKGYSDKKTSFKLVGLSSVLAAFGIMFVYFGLSYLGATSSSLFEANIQKAELLNKIIYLLFGNYGNLFLGTVVFLACFTTGAALVSVTAEYFSKLSKRKLSYKFLVIIVTLFSIFVTNIGLEQIISFAAPILSIVYPAAIILVILTFFDKYIKNDNVYKFAAFSAMIFCFLEVVSSTTNINMDFLKLLPFSNEGLAWILPAFISGFIGFFMKVKAKNL
ncbi:branched-chain amino acid transport system II carrier protein [Arcobacter vandammei]|uniref:branched-chain amino acid transport system II carrier protein n=1 Tax=Arcobacter vandammei TaxID=2782243 RepID=UPI0018DF93D3|nr:branched-chain amino acid transport system II carrier protein [Arcobacter vandammei]